MSIESTHMAKDNHVDGIRMMVVVASYIDVFRGITWDNIKTMFNGTQSYGNTMFIDALIVAYWFKNYFNITKTSNALGYSGHNSVYCLIFRLRRLNIKNFYKVFVALVLNGLIEPDHMRPILTMNLPTAGFTRHVASAMYRGKFFKYFCKRLVMDTLNTMVPVKLHPQGKFKVRQASEALMVPMATIRYWRDLQVEDVMIKG